jgi:hypothetical protein
MAIFSVREDFTFYRRTTQVQPESKEKSVSNQPGPAKSQSSLTDSLFSHGEKKKEQDKLQAQAAAKQRVTIKYFAPQVL